MKIIQGMHEDMCFIIHFVGRNLFLCTYALICVESLKSAFVMNVAS